MLNRSAWQGEWLMVRRHVLVWIVAAAAIALTSFAASGEDPRTARELHEALLRLNLLIPVFMLPFIAAALAPVFYLREVEQRSGCGIRIVTRPSSLHSPATAPSEPFGLAG